ncbi:MAG: hypothetical protein RIQ68_1791 [Pseudomonadota bacterium]|jgi:hypothetical protein
MAYGKNLPIVIDGTTAVAPHYGAANAQEAEQAGFHQTQALPPPSADRDFNQEPPIEIIIDTRQLKERIIDYLGAVLARCWIDPELLDRIEAGPHRALRHMGILLPDEIDIKVERKNAGRPRLLIYEWNQERSYKRRICYLQLVMMAGK